MHHFKDIIKSYNTANVSNKELINAIACLYPAMDAIEDCNSRMFWKAMRKFHSHIKGKHFDEMYGKHQVSKMYHTKRNGSTCEGEVYSIEEAKHIYDTQVKHINMDYTCWDVYVAINAQYHDYCRMYAEWYPNITKDELDDKIITSAITFWFKDEDAGICKVWNYFDVKD